MKSYYLTDPGKLRDHNEDSVIIVNNKQKEYLMVVSDGMGGHSTGEIASSLAIKHLSENFIKLDTVGEKNNAIKWLKKHVTDINEEIFEYTSKHEKSKGMGATLVIALLTKDYLLFANIGDSSGYVLKDNKIHKVTHDHTLVNLLVLTGELSKEEAREHPKKNILMKALGATKPVEVDIFEVERNIDSIFLCSDGLTNMLTDDQIERILISDLDTKLKAHKLVNKSNIRGGTDNISVALLEKVVHG